MKTFMAVALVGLMAAVPAIAQAPTAGAPCEQTLLEVRLLMERVVLSRQQTEIDASKTMARLARLLDHAQAEITRLRNEAAQAGR